MRIAMFMPGLAPDSLGWAVHLDFANAVRELGHRFDMLTTTSRPVSTGSANGIRSLPVPPLWKALGKPAAPLLRTRALLPGAGALATHLRRDGGSIDVLHVEVAYPHGAAAALAVRASGWDGPLVVTPMGEDTLVLDSAQYGFRRYPIPRALVSWTLRRAAFIRCISPMLEEHVAALAPDTPRRVVPLNVSGRTSAAAAESASERTTRRTAARRDLDAELDTVGRRVILALGRLHPFKGVETLVSAMSSLKDGVLLIAGPSLNVRPFGDTAARLLRMAEELGTSGRVRWIGPVSPERSLDLLAAADVVAVPSHVESLNKVCVEAAAVGTPFVVTETTGISAWVTGRGDGIVVPPGDPATLGRALAAVMEGRWEPDAARLAAFAMPFSPTAVATELVDIYRSILPSHPGGAGGGRI